MSKATDVTAQTVAPVIGEFTTAIKAAQDQLAVVTSVEDGLAGGIAQVIAAVIEVRLALPQRRGSN